MLKINEFQNTKNQKFAKNRLKDSLKEKLKKHESLRSVQGEAWRKQLSVSYATKRAHFFF